jgi:hypothetical protein
MLWSLAFGGEIKQLVIEQEQVKKLNKYGDITVVIEDVDSLYVPDVKDCAVESADGNYKITTKSEAPLVIRVPASVEAIEIGAVSSNVNVLFKDVFLGKQMEIENVSGKIMVKGRISGKLTIASVLGEIELETDSLDLSNLPEAEVSSVSGSITFDKLIPGSFKVETVTGSITIESSKREFDDSLYNYEISTLQGKLDIPDEIVDLLNLERAFGNVKTKEEGTRRPGYFDQYPELAYNRVLGLQIPLMFSAVKDWGRYNFGVSYGTASNRFYYYIDLERFFFEKGITPGAGLTIYDHVVNSEPWKVDVDENSWLMFLFKNDLLDYYRVKGFRVYSELKGGPFGFRISLNQEERFPQEVNTKFSIFKGSDAVRANPSLIPGLYTFTGADLMAGPLNFRVEYYLRNPENRKIYRAYGSIEDSRDFRIVRLFSDIDFGYSNYSGFPYGFTLGGVSTLPGYSTNSIASRYFMNVEEYIIFPTKIVDFVVGGYCGYANESLYMDFLAGLNIFKGLGVYVTRDRERHGLKYYMRFEAKI